MPNLANILGLLGMGGGNQGYNPDPQTMGLLAQLNRDNNGMPEPDRPVTSQLQQQLNRHPQFGLLNAPQSQAPGLPIFAGNPDIPAPNVTPAGPAQSDFNMFDRVRSMMPEAMGQETPKPPPSETIDQRLARAWSLVNLNKMEEAKQIFESLSRGQRPPSMPPVRPAGLGFNAPVSPERPAAAMAPTASPAAPMAAPAPQQANQPGFFDKLGTAIGSIYGGGTMPGDNLIALGAGLMSGPNAGAGLMKGMAMVNANNMTADKRLLEREQARQKLLGLSGNVAMLQKAFPGRTMTEYAAMAQQPQIIQEALKRTDGAFTGQPQLVDVQNPDGSTTKQWLSPGQTSGNVVSTTPAPPGLPPGANPQEYSKGLSQKAAEKQQSDADKRDVGETVMPYIDRAYAAYKRLGELNAIGPISASGAARFMGGVTGTEAEKLRQDFEAAAKQLELTKAQIQMKGQGQITEGERKILALTLPRLDAADPTTGLKTLEMLRADFMRAGRGSQQQQQQKLDPLGIR